ncbi:MAG: putative Ig domain-containing protein [Clostridia bacterium]|nr:putative Ig domain-containing protein [Clostridia bacterium]
MKNINKFKRLSLGLTSVALSAIICASCGALSALAETRNGGLEEPVGGNYFLSDYQNRSELSKAAYSVRSQIYDEGLVMLKNEDNALPLGKGAKISVFGKNNGRAGFSSSAFVNEGFEINPELVKFYGDSSRSGSGAASLPHANITLPGLATGETPIANYDSAVESSYENYSDAAIVYFSRSVGEGRDSPRTMLWNGSSYGAWKDDCTEVVPGARSGDDHYLQLDQNEADLLKYVGDRFDKVVVVLTCGSQMETGFLDDPNHYAYHENIKAAFWGGNSTSLARILSGKVNPSGKTTDTWYRDFKLDPTWQSAGNNGVLDGNEYSNLASSSDYLNRYVIYQEGIYVGYRYYETRGYLEGDKPYTSPASGDMAFHGTTTTEWDNWYDAHVVTPFGFGLSYTTFDWEVVEKIPAENSALTQDSTVSISVKVTNSGSVAGKEVVQLYYTAPYTEGGIEKAHVVLGAFDKTDLLEPGESQTLTLNLRARDMASYDWNDANGNDYIGYELDAGNYTLRVMRNSHEEVAAIPYVINENIQYSTSEATGATIKNRFDKVSNYLINDVKKQYMSRADFVGTFPTKQIKISAPQWVIDGLKEWEVANQVSTRSPDADKDMPYYTEVMPTTGAQNGIVLSDLYRKDYDDPLWDSFLDQLTYEQLVQLATRGSYFSGINIPELGITKAINTDGIGGLSAYAQHKELIGEVSNTSWGAQVTLAATWNVDLAYAKGRIIGNEGLWGGSVEYTQIPGYYAPGVNLHRTPFGGRNSQYFSEDGFFTGVMAAEIVKGANDKGMFTYVKHFGVNEQETNRIGVLTWANEQSMREIYFKGFELCVTEGKATGIMSALNRIGYEWTGGSYALLTELLREEWGFNGCVVTDSYMGDNSNLSNADQMIRAGGNLALGNATLKYNPNTPTTVAVLREMAHGLLYMHANSMVLNSAERPIIPAKIKAYIGDILPTGSYMFPFEASVATAEINSERYPEYTAEDVTYALAEDSNPLPEGLTLNSNGTITGTPTEMVENYKITVNATCVDYTSSATFTLNITSGEAEIVYSAASSVLQSAYVGKEYVISVASAQIFAPGLSEDEIAELPTITYGLKNGSALPAGLRLTSGGKIIGVPVEQCKNYSFSVVAFADGISSKTITFTMSVLNDIEIDSKELKLGRFGQNYLDKLDYECDTKVSFQLKEGSTLPNGLALTEGGYVVGKPTQTVTEHKFTVVATSEFTEAVEVEYSISVGVKFDETTKVPNGEVGKAYSTRIDTAQGAGSLTYSIKEGSTLPEGLTLKEDGSITGTPTKAGVYEVTFVATADGKIGDEITLTIYVAGGGSCVASGVEVGSIAIAVVGVGALFALKKRKESK